MIVDDDDCVGGRDDGRPKDVPRMRDAFIQTAERNFLNTHEVITRIQQNHAERFLVQDAHFRTEQGADQLGRIDLFPRQRFPREALAQSESGHQLHGLGRSDSRNGRNFFDRAATQTVERLIALQKFGGDVDRVRTWQSRAQQNRNQLCVGQCVRAPRKQLFPRTIVLRHFANF